MPLAYTTSELFVIPDAATGVSITPSGVINVQSAWFQVSASTPEDWAIAAIAFKPGTSNVFFSLRVGVGAGGAETISARGHAFIGSILGVPVANQVPRCIVDVPIPKEITASSRVTVALTQNVVSVSVWTVKINYFKTPLVGNAPTTDATQSVFGATITPSAVSWANTSWAQLDASTADEMLLHDVALIALNSTYYIVEAGIGAGGSEVVIWGGKVDSINTSGLAIGGVYQLKAWPLVRIPSSSRFAGRFRKNTTSTSNVYIEFGCYVAEAADFPDIVTEKVQRWIPSANTALILPTPVGSWTNGTWVQFEASVPNPVTVTAFHPQVDISGSSYFEIDVGSGAGGSEVVITTHRWGGYSWTSGADRHALIRIAPASLSTSSRLSARVRPAQTGVINYATSLGVIDNPDFSMRGEQQLVYPAHDDPAESSAGAGVAWAWSDWAVFHPGFAGPIMLTGLVFDGIADAFTDVQLGLGDTGSEVPLTAFAFFYGGPGGTRDHPLPGYPIAIPAETVISFRHRKAGTSAATIDLTVMYIADPAVAFITETDPEDVTIPWRSTDRDVTLTATVTSDFGVVNEGTVTFTVAGLPGSEVGNVVNGVATVQFTVPGGTPVDDYDIHAEYSGTSNFDPSEGDAVLTVEKIPTVTQPDDHTLPYSDDDRDITITATVTNPDELVFEGDVEFTIDGIAGLETGTVVNGVVSVTFTIPGGTPVGVYTIRANYLGTLIFIESEGTSLLTIFDNPIDVPIDSENPRELQVDDVGAVIRVFVTDQAGDALDMSGADLTDCLLMRRPDDSIFAVTPDFQTDGTDGLLLYPTVLGDLPISGRYRLQYRHADDPLSINSSVTSFNVLENITP